MIFLFVVTGCFESNKHVTTHKINQDGLQALLVLPVKNTHNSTQALPSVIILGGPEGGIQGATETGKKLAEHGIAALAVGYFGMPELPATLNNIPLEYFNAAIKYIDTSTQLTRNQCNQIPVIGSSRGAELALLLGTNNKHFAPIIAISPSSHSWGALGDKDAAAWTVNNQPVPFVPRHSNPDYSVSQFVGIDYFRQELKHPDAKNAVIESSKINGQVLLIAGDDDRLWPSAEMAENIYAQFANRGLEQQVEKLIFPDAGHVIAPGLPSNIVQSKLGEAQTILFGGNRSANENAQNAGLNAIVKLIKSPICYNSKASFNPKKLQSLRELLNTSNSSSVVLKRAGEVVFEFGDIFEKHTIHSIRKPILNSLYG